MDFLVLLLFCTLAVHIYFSEKKGMNEKNTSGYWGRVVLSSVSISTVLYVVYYYVA